MGLAVWALQPMGPIRINDDIYYLQIEDIYFSPSDRVIEKQYPMMDWNEFTIQKYGPLESNNVSYYGLPGTNPYAENESIGIQLNLIDSYAWLKTKYKSHND